MFQIKRKIILFLIATIFVFLLTLAVILSALLPYHTIKLTALTWEAAPGTIGVAGIEQQNQPTTLLIKAKDGKTQTLAGTLAMNFADVQRVYLYEQLFQDNEKKSDKLQLYYFDGNDTIYSKEFVGSSGRILSVMENSTSDTIAVEFERTEEFGYCIIPLTKLYESDASRSCKFLDGVTEDHVFWHPTEPDTFIMFSPTTHTAKNYSVAIGQVAFYEPAEQPEAYAAITQAYAEQLQPFQVAFGKAVVWKFLSFVVVNNDQGWSIHRVPLLAKTSFFSDSNHLLVQEQEKLSIYQLSSRQWAVVLNYQNSPTAVYFYGQKSKK